MARWLTWVSHQTFDRMGVFAMRLDFSRPVDADRSGCEECIRPAGFQQISGTRLCSCTGNRPALSDSESFAARARKLVTRGFKPKDAAQITLQEITFENRNDPSAAKRAANRFRGFSNAE